MSGHIYAFLTATRVEWTGEGSDDYTEGHGWVDPRWSRYELHESRNDVRPVADWPEDDPTDRGAYADLEDAVGEAFNALPSGPESDNGDGTFYAAATEDTGGHTAHLITDDLGTDNLVSFSYALHFVRKFHGPNGWTEEDWHPGANGGLDPAVIGLA